MLMVNMFLATAEEFNNMAYGDKMMLGLVITGIGILMVFVILGLIILSINLMNLILDKVMPKIKLPKLGKKKAEAKKVEEVKTQPAPVAEPIYEEVDDKRVIACISAAVMQMLDEECEGGRKPNIQFRISSIRKVK